VVCTLVFVFRFLTLLTIGQRINIYEISCIVYDRSDISLMGLSNSYLHS